VGPQRGLGSRSRRPIYCDRSFADDAADNSTTSISVGIGCVIVLTGVDHQRRTARAEDGVRFALVEGDCGVDEFDLQRARRGDMQVWHVTGIAGAYQDAVVRIARIEDGTGRVEGERVAFAHGMNMEGVLSRRHSR